MEVSEVGFPRQSCHLYGNVKLILHPVPAQFSRTSMEFLGFYKFMFLIRMWPPWFLSIKREYVILSQEGGIGLFNQCKYICLSFSLTQVKSNQIIYYVSWDQIKMKANLTELRGNSLFTCSLKETILFPPSGLSHYRQGGLSRNPTEINPNI